MDNHCDNENKSEHFKDDSTFDKLLWSDFPEEDYLKHIINENSSSSSGSNSNPNSNSNNNNNNNNGDDVEKEIEAKLSAASKEMDGISIREEEVEVEEVPPLSSISTTKKIIGSSLEKILRIGGGGKKNKSAKNSSSKYDQTSLLVDTTEELEHDEEVKGALNAIRKSLTNAKNVAAGVTTATASLNSKKKKKKKNKSNNYNEFVDEDNTSSDGSPRTEEIEVIFKMNTSTNSSHQQFDVEEGGGGGGNNNNNINNNNKKPNDGSKDANNDDDGKQLRNTSSPHNSSVNLSLPSLPSLTSNRRKENDATAYAPASPPKNLKSKSAPGTPSTVIIEMRGHHHIDSDIDDSEGFTSNIDGSVTSSGIGNGSGNGNGKHIFGSDSDLSDCDDDGGCISSNTTKSSYFYGLFGFLKRAAKNNKLYRRSIILVIALLILFVILIVVAFVQLGKGNRESTLPPPSVAIVKEDASSSSSPLTPEYSPLTPEYYDSDFDIISELLGQDEGQYQGDVVSSPFSTSSSSDGSVSAATDMQDGTFSAPDPAISTESPTVILSVYDVDDDDAFIPLWEDNPSTTTQEMGAVVSPHQTLSNEYDTLTNTSTTTPGENKSIGEMLLQVINERLPETIPALLNDPSSPQYRAYEWAVKLHPPTQQELDINPMRLIQRYVLAVLYYITNGSEWTDSTGWLDTHNECTWYATGSGTADPTDLEDHNMCDSLGRIYEINLRKNNLSGPFPTEVVLLSDTLTYMRFNGNNFTGTIPSTIFDGSSGSYMTKLERFHIHWNSMTGTIPNIVGVDVDGGGGDNNDDGNGNGLPNLLSLRLGHNNFVGRIPWQLSGLSNLERLDIAANKLSGGIPFLLMDLSTLTDLDLSDNYLQGSIPSEIINLKLLINLELDDNKLTGTLPVGIMSELSNLEKLDISENELSGGIPFVGDLSALTDLDLSDNNLEGSIPIEITSLISLTNLELDQNDLTGRIPFGMCSKIKLPSLENIVLDCDDIVGCWCCEGCGVVFGVGGSGGSGVISSGSVANNETSLSFTSP